MFLITGCPQDWRKLCPLHFILRQHLRQLGWQQACLPQVSTTDHTAVVSGRHRRWLVCNLRIADQIIPEEMKKLNRTRKNFSLLCAIVKKIMKEEKWSQHTTDERLTKYAKDSFSRLLPRLQVEVNAKTRTAKPPWDAVGIEWKLGQNLGFQFW